jgi:energy-coupling factor transport system ATP-binding protein
MKTITSVSKLRLKFPGEKELLFKDLSVSVNKGEKVLLLGPSGCGKSTLLQVLSGLIPQAIELPIKSETIQVPDKMGFVFQDPDSQFCMPFADEELAFVLENLQVPRAEMTSRIHDLLETVALDLDNIHTRIHSLSGGMKQRLAIAAVLALDPEVLFLDEPTALIDEKGTKQVWDTVKTNAKEKTIIIVEHKVEQIIDFIDRVIVFTTDGNILADGDPSTIFTNYKEELKQYGIWYPGAWEDFIKNRDPRHLTTEDSNHNDLWLENFRGYRKKEVCISLDNAKAYSGEWIAVIGENGAGKSSLLLSLMQLLNTDGEYQINGKSINNIEDLHKVAYFVFQNPEYQFVTNTVLDEITYKLNGEKDKGKKTLDKRAEELLKIFGLHDKQKQHPYHLSLGQKRRLSVATAFLQNPKIMFLDEPTFGQDSQNTFELLELIEIERRKGTIIIMVTHDSNIVQHFATRVWEVRDGMVIDDWEKTENKQGTKENLYEYIL